MSTSLILPFISIAQEAEKGLDEKINDAFMPAAVWWEGLVLTTVPIAGYDIPLSKTSSKTQLMLSPFVAFHPYFGQNSRSIETS